MVDLRNYLRKRKQRKALEKSDYAYFSQLPYHCPKCIWGTDNLNNYVSHLENHLIKERRHK